MSPVQKTGRLTRVTATPMLMRSSHVYCLTADTMPAERPRRIAIRSAPAVSTRVALKRRSTSGRTARPSGMERPRSPWRT